MGDAGRDDAADRRGSEAVGVTQLQKHGPFQIRLKFGKQHYCVAEIRIGEDASEIAKKLRELAAQVEARSR